MYVSFYSPELKLEWDYFVKRCKNTHFFFLREYMEYHKDRFDDYSLMIYDDNNKLIALLPANILNNVVYSHGGLTFGGFLVNEKMTTEIMLKVFDSMKIFLNDKKVNKLIYKCMPYIYHSYPSEEDRYALFINGARLIRRDVSSTILMQQKFPYSKGRKWMINKAKKECIYVAQSANIEAFWELLTQVLEQRHHVRPVHSVNEVKQLIEKFAGNIKLFTAVKDEQMLAGALIYENANTVHTQYLANSLYGRAVGALDLVIHSLITDIYKDKQYFDFGISNENQGRFLNIGLIAQKEGYGARAVVHDFYEIDIPINQTEDTEC